MRSVLFFSISRTCVGQMPADMVGDAETNALRWLLKMGGNVKPVVKGTFLMQRYPKAHAQHTVDFLRYIGSVEISLDDFGTNLEDMAVGWIDDHPQIVDIGCAKGFDAREAHQVLARGRLAQRLVHAKIMGIAVG